jgi:hypothetical protein
MCSIYLSHIEITNNTLFQALTGRSRRKSSASLQLDCGRIFVCVECLQGSDWDILHVLLLRGSDGGMLRILLLQGSDIYITYRIIRNSFHTLSFKIQKDIQFPKFEFRQLYFLFLEHRTTKPRRQLNTEDVLRYEMSHKSPNFSKLIGTLKRNFGFYKRLVKSYLYKRSLTSSRILLLGFA